MNLIKEGHLYVIYYYLREIATKDYQQGID
jgi:hypothetical protein